MSGVPPERSAELDQEQIPCPFVYANGKLCPGHVTRVEAYKADLSWEQQTDGSWQFSWGQPRSHFHAFCSLKGNHAGFDRPDADRMKLGWDHLPKALWERMKKASGS